jgi:hypothetical protein
LLIFTLASPAWVTQTPLGSTSCACAPGATNPMTRKATSEANLQAMATPEEAPA